MDWLSVRNWERFQHYKDRNPPWIKFYVDLLEDEDYLGMSPNAQLVYTRLLLVAARRDNAIRYDVGWLAVEVTLPRSKVASAVIELVASAFVIVSASRPASKPASTDASPRARPRPRGETETETETETEPPKPPRPSRPPDALWDTLVQELGEVETKSERGRRNKALAELRAVNATPDEIHRRCRSYRHRWPDVDVTATALAANWSLLATSPNGPTPMSKEEREEAYAEDLRRRMAERGVK